MAIAYLHGGGETKEYPKNSQDTVSVDAEDVDFFKRHGYLIVRNLLTKSETDDLQRWAQEVHDWQPTPDSTFMPYEVQCPKFKSVLA
jgi:hypothetical protein